MQKKKFHKSLWGVVSLTFIVIVNFSNGDSDLFSYIFTPAVSIHLHVLLFQGVAYTRVVTPTQFSRVLHYLSLNVNPEELKLLLRKFQDPASGDVNYPAFVQTVDKGEAQPGKARGSSCNELPSHCCQSVSLIMSVSVWVSLVLVQACAIVTKLSWNFVHSIYITPMCYLLILCIDKLPPMKELSQSLSYITKKKS